jgi:Glyoxalase-like domain
MTASPIGSMLLASTNPKRLRDWYLAAFEPEVNGDGFLLFGPVALLIDQRHDIADRTLEPGRLILNVHVTDAAATAAHLDQIGVTWIAPLEDRGDGWFATLADPDGNIVQIIELSADYLTRQNLDRQRRDG